MPTASPYRVRERRVAVMLNQVQALSADAAPPSPAVRQSFLLTLAPALAVFCGMAVFFLLSHREQVWPRAAVRAVVEATPATAPAPRPKPPETVSVPFKLRSSRRFVELGGLSVRLSKINLRAQFCDVDVRSGKTGYRRVRLHPGQTKPLAGNKGALLIDAMSPGQVRGFLQKGRI